MKNKYKFRKQWMAIASELGMSDKQFHVAQTNPTTKKDEMVLINNYRRFVRGMCEQPPAEQEAKLVEFKAKMSELKEANAQTRKEAEADMQGIVQKPEGSIV